MAEHLQEQTNGALPTIFNAEICPKVLGSALLGPPEDSRHFHCLQQSPATSSGCVTASSALCANGTIPHGGVPWLALRPLQQCS